MDISKLLVAALAVVVGTFWFGFIRRSAEHTAFAIIASKGYVSGGIYTQVPVGANRGFTTPNSIAIAESNAFELQIDGSDELVRASFNTVKSRQFEVGQRVTVQIRRQGILPFWQRLIVVEMKPADAR